MIENSGFDIASTVEGLRPYVPLVTALAISLRRLISSPKQKRKSKALEDLDFISAFLAFDVTHRNRLVVEQAFAAHMKHAFDFEEIAVLLKFKNPTKAFRLVRVAHLLLSLRADGKFHFNGRFTSDKFRKHLKWVLAIAYIGLLYLGMLPVLYAGPIIATIGWFATIPLVLWPIGWVTLAGEALQFATAISGGERLLKEQENGPIAGQN